MSYDVFAQAFRDGGSATGDAAAARAVIAGEVHSHDPQFDLYDVQFADGSYLEMYAGGLDGRKSFNGAMFAIRSFGGPIGDFMFRFCRAAGFVLFAAKEAPCVLLTEQRQSGHLPVGMVDDFRVIMVTSGAELLAALHGGYEGWRNYRDKIVSET